MSLDEVEVGDHLDGHRKQKIVVEKRLKRGEGLELWQTRMKRDGIGNLDSHL